MKKILLSLLALGLLLTGCSKQEETKTVDLENLRQEIMTELDFVDDFEYDEAFYEQTLYLSADVYETIKIVGSNPMMSPRGLEIVMVEAKDGKIEDVEAAIAKRVEYGSGPNTEFYGAMESAERFTIDNYSFLIVAGEETAAVKGIIEAAFE